MSTPDTEWEGTHSGFGRCLCPGIDPSMVRVSPDCSHDAGPAMWGAWAKPLSAACVPALDEKYAIEVVARGIVNPSQVGGQLGAAVDSQNRLHVVASDQAFAHFVRTNQGWTREVISSTPATGASLLIDSTGVLSAAGGADAHGHAVYATNASGAWQVEGVGLDQGAAWVTLALDAQGKPHLSYNDHSYHVYHAARVGTAFKAERTDILGTPSFVSKGGTLSWLYDDFDGLTQATLGEAGQITYQQLSKEFGFVAADASAGELYLATSNINDTNATLYVGRVHDGMVDARAIWTQNDPRFIASDNLWASLVATHDGSLFVAQVATSGLVLHTVSESKVSQAKLAPDRVRPVLLVDQRGEPHVLYHALDEIRHVFRGHCP
jgi:hypothetical protein